MLFLNYHYRPDIDRCQELNLRKTWEVKGQQWAGWGILLILGSACNIIIPGFIGDVRG